VKLYNRLDNDKLSFFATKPFAFLWRYVRARFAAHAGVVIAVLGATTCSVSTQYILKLLVDALSRKPVSQVSPWEALFLLIATIGADNLLWRIAGCLANLTFVNVTGDVRRDLFGYLTLHGSSYFAERPVGSISSRLTTTSNAAFTLENMFVLNVLPHAPLLSPRLFICLRSARF